MNLFIKLDVYNLQGMWVLEIQRLGKVSSRAPLQYKTERERGREAGVCIVVCSVSNKCGEVIIISGILIDCFLCVLIILCTRHWAFREEGDTVESEQPW